MKAKAPDVPNGQYWLAKDSQRELSIECERWVDARDIARRYFGSEVDVKPKAFSSYPRAQVRWVGSAAGLSDLRKQVRIVNAKNTRAPWKELQDFP